MIKGTWVGKCGRDGAQMNGCCDVFIELFVAGGHLLLPTDLGNLCWIRGNCISGPKRFF